MDDIPLYIKIPIEHMAEALERAISRSDPQNLNALDGHIGRLVNFLLMVVPPQLTAVALNLIGELVGRRLAQGNPIAGMAVEEVSERIGIGLRNLAVRARQGHRPTQQEVREALGSAAEEAHGVLPNMQAIPEPPLSIWTTWTMREIDVLMGILAAAEDEQRSDDTPARRNGDNDSNGLEGDAWQISYGLPRAIESNPNEVRRTLNPYDHDNGFEWARMRPWEDQRRLIMTAKRHCTGPMGWLMVALDKLDALVPKDRLYAWGENLAQNRLPKWLGWGGGALLFIGALWLIGFIPIALLYLRSVDLWSYGLGFIEKPGFLNCLVLLTGDWHYPPLRLSGSHILSSVLLFTVFRSIFAPYHKLPTAIKSLLSKFNPFSRESLIAPLVRWAEQRFSTQILRDDNGQQANDGRGREPWSRHLAILMGTLIPLGFGAGWAMFWVFDTIVWTRSVTRMTGWHTFMVAAMLIYFIMEFMSFAPHHWNALERKRLAQKGGSMLLHAFFVILPLAFVLLGLSFAFNGSQNASATVPSSSTTHHESSSEPQDTKQKVCEHFKGKDKKPSFCP